MVDVEKIKRLREKQKLSQTECAAAAGMKVQQWNNIEAGRAGGESGIKVGTLEKVAKALGVKAKDLLK